LTQRTQLQWQSPHPPDQPAVGVKVKLPLDETVTVPAPAVGADTSPTTAVPTAGWSFASSDAPAPGLNAALNVAV
jgi:hypothetical protein